MERNKKKTSLRNSSSSDIAVVPNSSREMERKAQTARVIARCSTLHPVPVFIALLQVPV